MQTSREGLGDEHWQCWAMVNPGLVAGGPGTSAAAFLADLYDLLDHTLAQAAATLAGTAGMGGRVATFTGPYDTTARQVFTAGCDLAGAVARLRLMVMTTFDNYTRAEAAAHLDLVAGHPGHMGRPARPATSPYPLHDPPPSAAGHNGGEPWIWHLITRLRPGAQWPDLRTGTLRQAAGGWSTLAAAYAQAQTYLECATAELDTYHAPELPLACAVLTRLGTQMTAYAHACSTLAATLASLAEATDTTITQIEQKCHQAQLEAETGGVIGLTAAALTFGAGAAGTQTAFSAIFASTLGLTIADLATDFLATVATLCESFQIMAPIVETSALAASGILEVQTVQAGFESMESAATIDGELTSTVASNAGVTVTRLRRLEATTDTHVLKLHTARTVEQLGVRFLTNKKLKRSSTFWDEATAVACINDGLEKNESKIEEWLATPTGEGLGIDGQLEHSIGIVMRRNGSIVRTSHYRLFLIPDSTQPEGFRILTGYPDLE